MNITTPMTSSRPYLLKALNDWIVDNHLTPYIVVDAIGEHVLIPQQFVENGKIVLNISPFAVKDLDVSFDFVRFSARFGGKSMNVQVPVKNVLAIYAKENGQGMVFTDEPSVTPPPTSPDDGDGKKPDRSHLKVVK